MPENHDIKISQWPKQKALLEHYFKLDEPCPVSILFEDKPAHVKVGNEKGESLDVDMNMNLKVVEDIPVCIKICNPICAVSDYSVGIELFGQPLASIRVQGETQLGPCKEESNPTKDCVDFTQVDPKQDTQIPLTTNGIQFTPLNDSSSNQFTTIGLPTSQLKISIPNEGLRIDFPQQVGEVELRIVNFGNPVIQVNAFNQSTLISNQTVMIENTTATVNLSIPFLTAIEIKGGSNEAALIDACFFARPDSKNIHSIRVI